MVPDSQLWQEVHQPAAAAGVAGDVGQQAAPRHPMGPQDGYAGDFILLLTCVTVYYFLFFY